MTRAVVAGSLALMVLSPLAVSSLASAIHAPRTASTHVWLCGPSVATAHNPCLTNENATAIAANGTQSAESSSPATSPKIDCFYIYPTVSKQTTLNANLKIEADETNVAYAQASRFSNVCRVFAPLYRQVTVSGLFQTGGRLSLQGTSKGQMVAYAGVVAAWKEYLARYNHGRGVVLIGHSQGTYLLRELVAKQIDNNANVRRHVISALLLGGNVLVPQGKLIGGDFNHVGACTTSTQLHCVVAYSAFNQTPPPNSYFGETSVAGDQVLCTNPAALLGGPAPLTPYFPTKFPFASGMSDGVTATKWVTYPGLFTGECQSANGATWLNVTENLSPSDSRPVLSQTLGAVWGLHLADVNITLGDLVLLVRHQSVAYLAR